MGRFSTLESACAETLLGETWSEKQTDRYSSYLICSLTVAKSPEQTITQACLLSPYTGIKYIRQEESKISIGLTNNLWCFTKPIKLSCWRFSLHCHLGWKREKKYTSSLHVNCSVATDQIYATDQKHQSDRFLVGNLAACRPTRERMPKAGENRNLAKKGNNITYNNLLEWVWESGYGYTGLLRVVILYYKVQSTKYLLIGYSKLT